MRGDFSLEHACLRMFVCICCCGALVPHVSCIECSVCCSAFSGPWVVSREAGLCNGANTVIGPKKTHDRICFSAYRFRFVCVSSAFSLICDDYRWLASVYIAYVLMSIVRISSSLAHKTYTHSVNRQFSNHLLLSNNNSLRRTQKKHVFVAKCSITTTLHCFRLNHLPNLSTSLEKLHKRKQPVCIFWVYLKIYGPFLQLQIERKK